MNVHRPDGGYGVALGTHWGESRIAARSRSSARTVGIGSVVVVVCSTHSRSFALPCFLLLAVWGRQQWGDRLIVGVSLPLLAYFAVLFSHWYFVG